MKVRQLTIGLVSLLLLVPLLLATRYERRIKGVVTDEKGQPIDQADVMVLDDQGKTVGRVTTGVDGRYSVPVAQLKPYSIGVYKFGYHIATRRIAADSNDPQNFSLTLRRVYKKGDRVRVLDAGWCPGTIIGVNRKNERYKEEYDVELDPKPSLSVTATVEASQIRPLDDEAPKSKLPCSYFEN
jgi:hypothetical protein